MRITKTHTLHTKTHFTHEIENPWPLHLKHSHWWKRRSQLKFTSPYTWGTNGVCECMVDVQVYVNSYMASNGSCIIGHLDYFQKPPLGGKHGTKPRDHGTPNAHNRWLFYFNHRKKIIMCEDPLPIETHWNRIWLRGAFTVGVPLLGV